MSRPQTVGDAALIGALAEMFREYGYEGASLSRLADAAGLQKASLYHRFPGGKRQMAEEVLEAASTWLDANILTPLTSDAPPARRLKPVIASLREFYDCGRKSCLLNMLASPTGADGPFAPAIARAFELLIEAFAALARDAGQRPQPARRSAETAVALLQGSLVVSRGLGDGRPFERFLADLPSILIPAASAGRKA